MTKDAEGDPLEGKSLEELARAERNAAEDKTAKAASKVADDDDVQDDDQDADDKKADADDDPLMVAKWFDEVTGSKEARNYANDHEWARGMKEAVKLVGKRSEQAQLGQKVLEAFAGREDDLLNLLATGSGKTADGKPKDDLDGPIEWSDGWISQDDNGKLVPTANAPPDAMDRYRRLQARYRELATNPGGFVRRILEPELKKLEQAQTKTKEELEQDRERSRVESLCLENKSILYVDGDPAAGMTTEGTSIQEMVLNEEWKPRITDWYTRVETAIELTRSRRPVDHTRKPPKRATRKADVAAGPRTTKSEDERLLEKGLAAVLMEDYEAAKTAG